MTVTPPAAAAPSAPKKEYTECRIQIRATGAKVSGVFKPTDTLDTVFAHVRAQLPAAPASFSLNTTHPRREFTVADGSLTLVDAGLMPSAALMLRAL